MDSSSISTSVDLLGILPEDVLVQIIMNFDIYAFLPLIWTCKKIHQLSLKTAWKIMVPSFPKRPPDGCLQFVCRETQRSGLPPILISPEIMSRCPNDFQANALIISLHNPFQCSSEKLTSMVIYLDERIGSLTRAAFNGEQLALSHSGLVRERLQGLKRLDSLMLKGIYISQNTLEYLNGSTTKKLHLKFCSLNMFSGNNACGDKLAFNSLTKLHIEIEGLLVIDSSYMFKNLRELVIHQYCPNHEDKERAQLEILASDFEFLEHL